MATKAAGWSVGGGMSRARSIKRYRALREAESIGGHVVRGRHGQPVVRWVRQKAPSGQVTKIESKVSARVLAARRARRHEVPTAFQLRSRRRRNRLQWDQLRYSPTRRKGLEKN